MLLCLVQVAALRMQSQVVSSSVKGSGRNVVIVIHSSSVYRRFC